MDKAQYREKIQQIKHLEKEGKYNQAADIIAEINWKRVRSASGLMHVGIIMGKAGRYEEAKELLLSSYDRAPVGRDSVYWLTEFAIRQGNLQEAGEFFEEYLNISPDDPRRYILEYKLKKAQVVDIDILINLLEILKEKDFTDEWGYQLAYLYYKNNQAEKCIALCDEIILYFGDGPFVERAMELKMLFTPLSDEQAAKYEEIKLGKEGIMMVHPGDESGNAEILHQNVKIPTITENTAMFNTIDLQAEIAKNLQQIKEATEKETVDSSMDNIRRIVEESRIPIVEPTPEEEKVLYADMELESDEEIDASLNINFQEMLEE